MLKNFQFLAREVQYRSILCVFQSDRGLISMLKKYGEELGKSKGDNWLNDDFIMGVIMDMSAAGKLLIIFFI